MRRLDIGDAERVHRGLRRPAGQRLPAVDGGVRDLRDGRTVDPEEGEPSLRLYLLVVGALRSLAGRSTSSLVLDAFFLRAMANAGWQPAPGRMRDLWPSRRAHRLHVAAGGAVCPSCRPAGAVARRKER